MNPPSFMLITGEVSGDMHAAALVRAIKRRLPGAAFFGIGGDHMRAEGVETLQESDEMAVTGFWEAIRRFAFFKRVFFRMLDEVRARKPTAVILVDYPGFNLRFAARAHALGIPVIYYICPQVWAWNRKRIPRMARVVDRLITIFPFEAEHFAGTGLRVDFAGHPLVDEAQRLHARPEEALPWPAPRRVAILPGSRDHEIDRILPPLWKAAARLEARLPEVGFLLAAPSPRVARMVRDRLARLPGKAPARWELVTGRTREVLRQARAAFVASGTATLEASLMRCPMVIAYRVAPITSLVAHMVIRLSHVGMVNIVAGREVCPELLQDQCTPRNLCRAIEPLVVDSERRDRMLSDLDAVNHALGEGGAEDKAARAVLDELGLDNAPPPQQTG